MMRFAVASALLLSLFSQVRGQCDAPETVTQLDFFQSELVTNTLHLVGGELRYQGIGTYQDNLLDMTVTVTHGSYTDIEGYWQERGKDPDEVNGKRDGGKFGNINLQTKKGVKNSGEGNFRFCIVDSGTSNPVSIPSFSFTIWDLDWRKEENNFNGVSVKEKLIIDTSQAANYSLFPSFAESEISPICENGLMVTCTNGDGDCDAVHPGTQSCPYGQKTVFRASQFGTGPDNPKDPDHITDAQRKRAVSFFFEDTDCFDLTYAHYCPVDDDPTPYDWPFTENQKDDIECNMGEYSGGNFLFAGESDALYYTPGCPTAEPTDSPTYAPTTTEPPTSEMPTPMEPTPEPESSCSAPGSAPSNMGEVNMCLRTSLGYTSTGGNMFFNEVNFIETLITIQYDLSAGFCVEDFQVAPKEREERTETEDGYGLEAYLCNKDLLTFENTPENVREVPTKITSYNAPDGADTFNQGDLITVCVRPDGPTYDESIVMDEILDFTWKRDPNPDPLYAGAALTQTAIVDKAPSPNFLTSYVPGDCSGEPWCHFSSVLFAQYYYIDGVVTGEGNASMKFDTSRRRKLMNGRNNRRGLAEDELDEDEIRRRQLQAAALRTFDTLVSVRGNDEPGYRLKTAGGVSSLKSILVTVLCAALVSFFGTS